ncbi:Hypothetical predicted protein [Olea europaea subsp. europaea]|uniref:Uncharacterized protein n=1 Tax=Olea europaea subsp. europaea TaxID=158383 RepID=A0A8S0VJ51_OLEEU|nr:Hypothetical predicted protein [Olea europaea subsp. europaea]
MLIFSSYGQEAILNFAIAGLKCGEYDVGGLLQVIVAVDELDKQVYYMAVVKFAVDVELQWTGNICRDGEDVNWSLPN